MYKLAACCFVLTAFTCSAFSQQTTQPPRPNAIEASTSHAHDESGAAREKFVQQCIAVAANAAYCGCLHAMLPAAYTQLVDQPWLLFVISMYERKYVGELQQDDTEVERFNQYLLARGAVRECANSRS
jgi:hypothetical protein